MTPRDRDFLRQFDDCSLPETRFGHAGHIRMAWLRLGQAPFEEALARISSGIRRYAAAMGATTKYHETVTVAFARIIASRMRQGESFEEFTERNTDLFSPRPLLQRYYSPAVLASDRAKHEFVGPDREALPGPG